MTSREEAARKRAKEKRGTEKEKRFCIKPDRQQL